MRILIVEDEALSAMLLERQLKSAGHETLKPVATGEDAVRVACAEKPAMVLMDIRLAGEMDGIEAARQILSRVSCKLVFTSGYQENDIYERAMALKPSGYILKPIFLDALLEYLS